MHRLHEILEVEAPPAQLLLEVKMAEATRIIDKATRILKVEIPENITLISEGIRNLHPSTLIDHKMYLTDNSPYVSIPIHDETGKLRFIESRALDNTLPKYLRLPEDVTVDFLYNIDCGAPCVVLVEGIFDYLNLYDLGVRNACPIFGLYNFTKKIVRDLKSVGVVKVVTMLDNDIPGQKASSIIRKTAEIGGLMSDTIIPLTDPGDLDKQQLFGLLKEKNYTIKNGYIL